MNISRENELTIDDWSMVEKNEKKYPLSFSSFMQNTKATFYNIYRQYPREIPVFSEHEIWILGVRFQKKIISDDKNQSESFDDNSNLEISDELSIISSNKTPSSPSVLFQPSPNIGRHSSIPMTSISTPPTQNLSNSSSSTSNKNAFIGSTSTQPNLTFEDFFPPSQKAKEKKEREQSLRRVIEDVQSRVWCTYRKEFPSLVENGCITTDVGWSCMIRTGQMMLAQAFLFHFFGRGWRAGSQKPEELIQYQEIVSCFFDDFGHPFSLHSITSLASKYGHKTTDWHGPSSICRLLKMLCSSQPTCPFSIYMSYDGCIHMKSLFDNETPSNNISEDDISTSFGRLSFSVLSDSPRHSSSLSNSQSSPNPPSPSSRKSTSSPTPPPPSPLDNIEWRPLVLFIPVRLGMNSLNAEYIPLLKEIFHLRHSLGIIGGRPRASHYFIGYQNNDILYLDPHYVQPASKDLSTYQANFPLKMDFTNMDPSMSLGFYCRTLNDFIEFRERINEINKKIDFGLFTFV